jgi:hypothetical protein
MLSNISATAPQTFRSLGRFAQIPFEDNKPYRVQLPETGHIILVLGQKLSHRGSSFQHPALLARRRVLHWFKHTRANGAKSWTSRAGVDLCFAIPTNKISLCMEPGFSFVRTEVNGVRVTLNVSGASDANGGWTDYVGHEAHCLLGMPVTALRKIAEVSVSHDELRREGWSIDTRLMDEQADNTPRLFVAAQAEIDSRQHLKAGAKVAINDTVEGYANVVGMVESFSNAPFRLSARLGDRSFSVKRSQVDWTHTAEQNGLAVLAASEVREVVFTPPAPAGNVGAAA